MKLLIMTYVFAIGMTAWAGPGHTKPGGHMHAVEEKQGHSHGPGSHSHGPTNLNQKEAKEAGQFHIERLVKIKKIDQSWLKGIFDKSEQKMFGKKTEWVVTFLNEKGVKGKKLYIFLKPSGEFVAANFTGK